MWWVIVYAGIIHFGEFHYLAGNESPGDPHKLGRE